MPYSNSNKYNSVAESIMIDDLCALICFYSTHIYKHNTHVPKIGLFALFELHMRITAVSQELQIIVARKRILLK